MHLYRRLGDVRGEAAMLVFLGSVSHHTGEYAAAGRDTRRVCCCSDVPVTSPSFSVALNNLANIAKEEGHIDESISLYESLASSADWATRRGIAITLNNLGTMALSQGDMAGPPNLVRKL